MVLGVEEKETMEGKRQSSREKKPFVSAEVKILLEEIALEKSKLFGPNSQSHHVTQKVRNQIWDAITKTVNTVGDSVRTREEVKEKWRSLKTQAIEKAREKRDHHHEHGDGVLCEECILVILEESRNIAGVALQHGKHKHHGKPQTPAVASSALRSIEDAFWEWRTADAPEFATAVGENQHNDKLEFFEIIVYKQRETKVQGFLRRLERVDRSQLNQQDRLDMDIFTNHLQTFCAGAAFDMYQSINPVNFLEGINADPSRLQSFMPFEEEEDFENYLARLQKIPTQIDQKIELLRYAVKRGRTLNKVSVVPVPDQIDDIVEIELDECPFFTPAFTEKLDEAEDISEEYKGELRSEAAKAVGEIHSALLRLKDCLENEYIPAGRESWGVSGWKDGRELYELCLQYHTSTDMTPHEVHELGLREVDRIRGNMKAAMKRLGFDGTVKQFYNSIRSDPRFLPASAEDMLETFRDLIDNKIMPKLPMLFKDIPEFPLRVEAMSYDGPGGVYMNPTPDGSVPGIFYANVMHPESSVTISNMALTLHETVPGHHMQAIYSLSSQLPPYRGLVEDDHYYRMPATFPVHTAYMEGWGLYAEYLGEEMGMYTDDYMLMGRYSEEILRACRLVVDTGLHYFEWEREKAIQYLLDNTAESVESVTVEIDRYLTWPGQATAYKVGEIKIKALRKKAADMLGSKFDIRDFHSLLLENGGMPLNLLERLVDEWIIKVRTNKKSDRDLASVG